MTHSAAAIINIPKPILAKLLSAPILSIAHTTPIMRPKAVAIPPRPFARLPMSIRPIRSTAFANMISATATATIPMAILIRDLSASSLSNCFAAKTIRPIAAATPTTPLPMSWRRILPSFSMANANMRIATAIATSTRAIELSFAGSKVFVATAIPAIDAVIIATVPAMAPSAGRILFISIRLRTYSAAARRAIATAIFIILLAVDSSPNFFSASPRSDSGDRASLIPSLNDVTLSPISPKPLDRFLANPMSLARITVMPTELIAKAISVTLTSLNNVLNIALRSL